MFYLIGVAHRAQAKTRGCELTEAQGAFAACLRHAVEEIRPDLIAEENSEEALATNRQTSIAKEVADEAEIEHRLCDPNQEQRQAIGYVDGATMEMAMFMSNEGSLSDDEIRNKARAIEIARYFPLRERFWLDRLEDYCNRDVLFICGDAHVQTFARLLEREGTPCRVLERGIGVNDEDRLWFDQALQYLAGHPELGQ